MARLPYTVPYDPAFLGGGYHVPLPTANCSANLVEGGRVFDYIHFSVVMHQSRRLAVVTAHNIDATQRKSVNRTGWGLDTRMPATAQTGQDVYDDLGRTFQRGHLVRRAAVAWGSVSRAKDASDSTFFFTNGAPQHRDWNGDEWLALENWVLDQAGDEAQRLCVFTGPIYSAEDHYDAGVRIPAAFFKIVALRDPAVNGDDLTAFGFVMKQNIEWDDLRSLTLGEFAIYQTGIAEIGAATGLDFGALESVDNYEWSQPRFRDRSRLQPRRINGPEDLVFAGSRRRSAGVRALPTPSGEEEAVEVAEPMPCASCADRSSDLTREQGEIRRLSGQVNALQETVELMLERDAARLAAAAADGEDDALLEEFRANRDAIIRIVGGNRVAPGEFDECACIGGDYGAHEWGCSGVLVHPRVVLTAAHCADTVGSAQRVLIGTRSVNNAGVLGELVDVESAFVHPDYDDNLVPSHDIAVLILAEDAATVPVAIATDGEARDEDDATIVGFGFDNGVTLTGFGTKRRANVPITKVDDLSADERVLIENAHGFDDNFEVHMGVVGSGVDTCNGDSGGPAYVGHDDARKVAGVTSRAAWSSITNCGDGGIYTRIAPYLSWISEVTGGLIDAPAHDDNGDAPAHDGAGGLYISAAQPNPSGPDVAHEWVELTNGGAEAIDLAGYALSDRQGGSHDLAGTIGAGAVLRFTLPEGSPVRLANSGDDIKLHRAATLLHEVSYSSAGSGEVISFAAPGDGGDGGDGTGSPIDIIGADPC